MNEWMNECHSFTNWTRRHPVSFSTWGLYLYQCLDFFQVNFSWRGEQLELLTWVGILSFPLGTQKDMGGNKGCLCFSIICGSNLFFSGKWLLKPPVELESLSFNSLIEEFSEGFKNRWCFSWELKKEWIFSKQTIQGAIIMQEKTQEKKQCKKKHGIFRTSELLYYGTVSCEQLVWFCFCLGKEGSEQSRKFQEVEASQESWCRRCLVAS